MSNMLSCKTSFLITGSQRIERKHKTQYVYNIIDLLRFSFTTVFSLIVVVGVL